ncbi:hypothetical protein ACVWXO_006693 [Bradyrhizobium sp. LM2.7]
MHAPSITADCLAVLALACAPLALRMIRLRRDRLHGADPVDRAMGEIRRRGIRPSPCSNSSFAGSLHYFDTVKILLDRASSLN